jgi:AP-2 complex subunit alpha
MGTDVVKNVNKNNASHAVLFEALALVSLQPKESF